MGTVTVSRSDSLSVFSRNNLFPLPFFMALDIPVKKIEDEVPFDEYNRLVQTVKENEEVKHSHANKAELDKIAAGKVDGWDDAKQKAHSHDNFAELAKILTGDIQKWNNKANSFSLKTIGGMSPFGIGDIPLPTPANAGKPLGNWNPNTNEPALSINTNEAPGDYYVVSTPGTSIAITGTPYDFQKGEKIRSTGSKWTIETSLEGKYTLSSDLQNADISGAYLVNVIDEHTKQPVIFHEVLTWLDGRVMTDEYVDHSYFVRVGYKYYKRAGDGSIDVRWLGVKPNAPEHSQTNTNALNALLSRMPLGTSAHLLFSKDKFYFAPLPPEFWAFERPTCIKTSSLGIRYQGVPGTQLIAEQGAGLFTQVVGFCEFIDLNLSSLGMDPMDGRLLDGNGEPLWPAGDIRAWHPDPGAYAVNGINCFGQARIHNTNIAGFSGNGLFVFGEPNFTLPATPRILHGTKTGLYISFTEPADINFWDERTNVYIGTQQILISGRAGGSLVAEGYDDAFIALPDGPYDITLKGVTPRIIADNGQITGVSNFDFNGCCGAYFAGSDGNQWSVTGLSMRENGNWGSANSAFLGTHYKDCHGSKNGKRFNYVDHPTEPTQLNVGTFGDFNVNGRSTYVGCYTEEGNQGPDYYARFAIVIGGIHAAGATGPGFVWSGDGPFPAVDFGRMVAMDTGLKFEFGGVVWHFGISDDGKTLGFSNPNFPGVFEMKSDGSIKMKKLTVDRLTVDLLQQLDAVISPSEITHTENILRGSYLSNKGANRYNNNGWVCTKSGLANAPATTYDFYFNGPTIVLIVPHSFKTGDIIDVNGAVFTLLQADPSNPGNGFYVSYDETSAPIPANGAFPLKLSRAEFMPDGNGIGTVTVDVNLGTIDQRPTPTADLKDFMFYGTDTKIWYRCTGTGWE